MCLCVCIAHTPFPARASQALTAVRSFCLFVGHVLQVYPHAHAALFTHVTFPQPPLDMARAAAQRNELLSLGHADTAVAVASTVPLLLAVADGALQCRQHACAVLQGAAAALLCDVATVMRPPQLHRLLPLPGGGAVHAERLRSVLYDLRVRVLFFRPLSICCLLSLSLCVFCYICI